jgi:excisionase family DNA binding protein
MLTRKFMTVREVADLAQVSEATVRHWIRAGDLRAVDVGREFRIVPRDLEDFFDRHATRAVQGTAVGSGSAGPTGPDGTGPSR